MSAPRLRVGLLGLGRLGRVYARDLGFRIRETRLVAVCDPLADVVKGVADEFDVAGRHTEAEELVLDPNVDAVVIVAPTRTHKDLVLLCARAGKPAFCEKPAALSLADALAMKAAAEQTGAFLQMGFMRRFDPGYVAARARLSEGRIGKAVLFKSTSRDPGPPPPAYADPRNSGGLILDLGIHDFDLARFFMGEVATVSAIGGTFAHPELATVGDIDNAVITLTFRDGRLGIVDLSRNGVYGYDVFTEILGDAGALRVGYLRETPLAVMTSNSVAHDTVPSFLDRFGVAYTTQLQNFAQNVLLGRPAPVTMDDAVEAMRVALAARQSLTSGRPVDVGSVVS